MNSAAGKQERKNILTISAGQLQSLDLAGKLLGPTSERYVVRDQLNQLAQEIKSNLHIEETYEIGGEEFSEEFIKKILEMAHTTITPVPIDVALSQLSKYGVSHDQQDLSPDVIKRELSKTFKIRNVAGKQHIIVSDDYHGRTMSSSSTNVNVDTDVGCQASFHLIHLLIMRIRRETNGRKVQNLSETN